MTTSGFVQELASVYRDCGGSYPPSRHSPLRSDELIHVVASGQKDGDIEHDERYHSQHQRKVLLEMRHAGKPAGKLVKPDSVECNGGGVVRED